jgi:alkanesulfonate monooxygenase SsuD/methylene tetrahydromethanopterin reductase-like flavin-dependent oxidoreductase (luciferase family)
VTIRGSAEEAERVRQTTLAHNRTPMDRVAGDTSFWTGSPEEIADTILGYRRVGFDTFIVELAAPYDDETMSTLINVVKPMVESASVSA